MKINFRSDLHQALVEDANSKDTNIPKLVNQLLLEHYGLTSTSNTENNNDDKKPYRT